MNRGQFTILMVIAAACVCLSLVTIVFARQNQQLQAEVQAQQALINKGALSQQIGNNIVREMAAAAQSDEKLKQLLQQNGYGAAASPTP